MAYCSPVSTHVRENNLLRNPIASVVMKPLCERIHLYGCAEYPAEQFIGNLSSWTVPGTMAREAERVHHGSETICLNRVGMVFEWLRSHLVSQPLYSSDAHKKSSMTKSRTAACANIRLLLGSTLYQQEVESDCYFTRCKMSDYFVPNDEMMKVMDKLVLRRLFCHIDYSF
jgi:hypothetical protein